MKHKEKLDKIASFDPSIEESGDEASDAPMSTPDADE